MLRFDYHGCGDSAGTDEEPERVQRWIGSVHAAVDEIQRLAPGNGPTVLIGLRAGALLAAAAAASRDDIDGLVLWAPTLSGRLFLREQRAFSAMAHVTATANGKHLEQWGENGFEANGYVFTEETVAAFEGIDLKQLQLHARTRVLVLNRTDIPVRSAIPQSWKQSNISTEEAAAPGYPELMQPPWLSRRPDEAISRIETFVQQFASTAHASTLPVDPNRTNPLARALHESAVWYDKTKTRLAILTEPDRGCSTALILITSTFGYRVGPNRMNVACARRMAKLGIATLRIDLGCVSESRESVERSPNPPYHLDAINDVKSAVAFMKARGYEHVVLSGICAGAFLAWYTGISAADVSGLLLVNPETFKPLRYSLEDHVRTLQASIPWRDQLRQEKNAWRKLAILGNRGLRVGELALQRLRSTLPLQIGRPRVAMDINSLGRRGRLTSIIFSTGDSGIKELQRALGSHLDKLQTRGWLQVRYLDGPDHSFTPRWANRMLIESMADEMANWPLTASSSTQTADLQTGATTYQ
ncbi:MAG TPA: alpha/beta hydrolase [Steroidobacteraceae bacterium]|nr:alpha/beta hydrolase [Steroidobacteraceae bacterium]